MTVVIKGVIDRQVISVNAGDRNIVPATEEKRSDTAAVNDLGELRHHGHLHVVGLDDFLRILIHRFLFRYGKRHFVQHRRLSVLFELIEYEIAERIDIPDILRTARIHPDLLRCLRMRSDIEFRNPRIRLIDPD